jgi:exopolyphosphatase/guanosine-5'-triphosphate,3'-diphosphate pyrophosphatase
MRIAVFDLGSTSFHALVVDVDARGRLERVLRSRETLHLAHASARNGGHVPEDAAFQALRAVRSLRKDAERTGPDVVVASATSALRDATNGDHLIERLEVALRHPIRVLDGDEEAELAYLGATSGLGILDEDVLVADLGGGSLEIAVGRGPNVDLTATFPLGASRMTALHVSNDPPHLIELEAVERAVSDACGDLFATVRSRGPMRCVVAGGTGRAVARLLAANRPSDHIAGGPGVSPGLNGMIVPNAELHALSRRLASLNRDERIALGIQAKRVDVLPAGALILSCVAEGLDTGSLEVSEWGLREGLLLEAAERFGRPMPAAR